MDITKYLGMAYDYRNKRGVNCWGLYAIIMNNELGISFTMYEPERCTTRDICAAFTVVMIDVNNTHTEVMEPLDFDMCLLTKFVGGVKHMHCGVMWKGKLLHSKGSGRSGQVWYDKLTEYDGWEKRFYRYDY